MLFLFSIIHLLFFYVALFLDGHESFCFLFIPSFQLRCMKSILVPPFDKMGISGHSHAGFEINQDQYPRRRAVDRKPAQGIDRLAGCRSGAAEINVEMMQSGKSPEPAAI